MNPTPGSYSNWLVTRDPEKSIMTKQSYVGNIKEFHRRPEQYLNAMKSCLDADCPSELLLDLMHQRMKQFPAPDTSRLTQNLKALGKGLYPWDSKIPQSIQMPLTKKILEKVNIRMSSYLVSADHMTIKIGQAPLLTWPLNDA